MFKNAVFLLRETVKEWNEDGATHIAAALAYYAIFSLSPLLILIALVLGLVMDQSTVQTSLVDNIQATLGEQAAGLIRSVLQTRTSSSDLVGSLIWLAIIVWGASGMFAQLQRALNRIWEVKPRPGRSPFVLLKTRLQSFAVVVLAAVAMLGTTIVNTALSAQVERTQTLTAPEILAETERTASPMLTALPIRAAQFLISLAVTTYLVGLIFHVLPDVELHWKDVIVGAAFTGVLLYLGQFALGLYLSRANVGSVFGAAGSLTVILVWIYYSAQILLFGAEFTEVWARYHGANIHPDIDAVWENEAKARREAEHAAQRRMSQQGKPTLGGALPGEIEPR